MAGGRVQSLDQPVADFIVEWRSDPGKSKILIRHLLDMRTGLLMKTATGQKMFCSAPISRARTK
jgi:hypothetical protein